MAYRVLAAILVLGVLTMGIGCGGTDDENVFFPTPTQGPPTPTPLPICQGLEIPPPPALGCRPFTWTQPENSNTSPTQLFITLPNPVSGGFNFLPAMAASGMDPGPNFPDLPPGIALIAGTPDPETGETAVTIGVTEANQLEPGFVVLGVKPLLDYFCIKIDLASVEGTLFCNEGSSPGVDMRVTAETGVTPFEDDVIELRLGDSAPRGALFLKFIQQTGRIRQSSDPRYPTCFNLPECEPGQQFDCYRPKVETAFTSGVAFGMKGNTPLLNAEGGEGLSGEPFDCSNWEMVDGPGRLVQALVENDPTAPPPSDVATALRIAD